MERQLRVILISGIISAILGLITGFLGGRLAAPPVPQAGPVVQAQDFQLVDQAGRIRGRLGVDAHGAARLTLFGPDGALPRVSLAATPQGGGPNWSWATANARTPWPSEPTRTPGTSPYTMKGNCAWDWRCKRTARRPSISMIKTIA